MELLEYWKIFRKRVWLLLLLMVIAGSSAFYYTGQQVLKYHTSTTLFINPGEISPLVPAGFASSGNDRVQSLANTYIELMHTRSFIQLVVRKMERPVTEGEVRGALESQYIEGTQFFRISATHTNPATAQELANTAAEVLIAREIERQQSEQEQLEARRRNENAPDRQQFEELVRALEAEIAYYDERIENTEEDIANLQDQRSLSSKEEERLDALISLLPELRYARIDVQTRLADANYSLTALSETQETPVDTAVVVDEALLPTVPMPRNQVQNTLLAAMVGLMVGAGVAMLLEYVDYTIKTPEALDAVYGITTQGVIAALSDKERKRKQSYLVTHGDARSPIAESFRALRTGVQVAGLSTSLRTLLVTSAGPGEGKTFVASNLAASLALNGYRVILVDTDLRKPTIHKVFDLPRETGFTSLIVKREHELADVLQPTDIPNLQVLVAGPIPPNPAELLGASRTAEVMQQVQEQADIVIYDSPPVATVTDAALLAQRVDGVLQVVWAGHTRINLVQRSKAILDHVGAHIIGPVLNQVQTSDLGYYSYYYSYGYYMHNGNGNGNGKPRRGLRLPLLSNQSRTYRLQEAEMDDPIILPANETIEDMSNGHAPSSPQQGQAKMRRRRPTGRRRKR
jgi:capsular exopolysaccharide synthesis family protein